MLISFLPSFVALQRDWQRIQVYLGIITPYVGANLMVGDSITVYCGSLSAASWSYYLPTEYSIQPVSGRHYVGYRSIKLINLLNNDTGIYVCQGNYRRSYFSIKFSVHVWQNVPNGLVVPSWVEVSGGSSVTLTCGSITPVMWFSAHYNNQKKTVIGNTLTLHNLQGKHSGYYSCRGTLNQDGRMTIFHSSSRVIVDGYLDLVFDITVDLSTIMK